MFPGHSTWFGHSDGIPPAIVQLGIAPALIAMLALSVFLSSAVRDVRNTTLTEASKLNDTRQSDEQEGTAETSSLTSDQEDSTTSYDI